jgi:putative transposase
MPTYASWLNQVVRRFELITKRTIRRGSFSRFQQKSSAKQ